MGYVISYFNDESPGASSGTGTDWIGFASSGGGSGGGAKYGWVYQPPDSEGGKTSKPTPYLRVSRSGYMPLYGKKLLWSGGVCPELLPAAKIYISGSGHESCLLIKVEGDGSYSHCYISSKDLTAPALLLYRFPALPAEFTVYGGWQSGHYDHALVNSARIEAFGVSSGFMTLPLGGWRKMAFVRIDAERNVFVNNLKGDYHADS